MRSEVRFPLAVHIIFQLTRIQGIMVYDCKNFALSRDVANIPLIKDKPIVLSIFSGIFLLPGASVASYFLITRIIPKLSLQSSLIDFVFNFSLFLKILLEFLCIYVAVVKRRRITEIANSLVNTLEQLEALGMGDRKRKWGCYFTVLVVLCYMAQLTLEIVHANTFMIAAFYLKTVPIAGGLLRLTCNLQVTCFCVLLERGYELINLNLESLQMVESSLNLGKCEDPASLLRRLRVLYTRLEGITDNLSYVYGPTLLSLCTLGRAVLIFDVVVYIKMDDNGSHVTYIFSAFLMFLRLWMVCKWAHGLVRKFANMLRTTRLNCPRVTAYNLVVVDFSMLVSIGGASITFVILLTQIPSSLPADLIFDQKNA